MDSHVYMSATSHFICCRYAHTRMSSAAAAASTASNAPTAPAAPAKPSSRLCVKNLPPYLTDERLKKIFAANSDVTDVKIMRTRYIIIICSRRVLLPLWLHTLEAERSLLSRF